MTPPTEPPGENEAPAEPMTPADIAALLDADIGNIVALVEAGQPLTNTQRQRLTEFAKKMPAPKPAAPAFALASDPPAPAPVPTMPRPPEPIADAVPGDYREKLAVYAERYDYGLRSIKLWIAEGRAAQPTPLPPPLDNPEAMPGWWHAVKSNSVPGRLLAHAQAAKVARVGAGEASVNEFEGTGAGAAAASAANVIPGVTERDSTPAPLATGFAATLARVREAEAQASARYLAEFGKGQDDRDDAKTSRLRKEWSALSEELRFLEKAAPEILAKSGEMLIKSEVRRILTQLHAPIVAGVRALFRRVRSKAGAGDTLDDMEKIYARETERLFGELVASDFAPQ